MLGKVPLVSCRPILPCPHVRRCPVDRAVPSGKRSRVAIVPTTNYTDGRNAGSNTRVDHIKVALVQTGM